MVHTIQEETNLSEAWARDEEWSCDGMDGRTYPSNPQQLHLTVREKKRQPRITLHFELLEVGLVDGWRVVVRWGIMSGSQLGRHSGRGCRERGKERKVIEGKAKRK